MVGVYQRIAVHRDVFPLIFFYFSAGEFRTGQIPYRNVPYYISFKTSVPGRMKDGAHPLASEKGRKLH